MRHLLLFLVLPFSVLWAFFLGYEVRNLAVALPPLVLICGQAVQGWVERLQARTYSSGPGRVPAFVPLVLAVLVLAAANMRVSAGQLGNRQVELQREIFDAELNHKLYNFLRRYEGSWKMITNYPTSWLPELEGTWVNELFLDYDSYQNTLAGNPSVTLMLAPLLYADPLIQADIQEKINSGEYELIFSQAEYVLLEIFSR